MASQNMRDDDLGHDAGKEKVTDPAQMAQEPMSESGADAYVHQEHLQQEHLFVEQSVHPQLEQQAQPQWTDLARMLAEAIKMVREVPPIVPVAAPTVPLQQRHLDVDLKQFLELKPPVFRGGLSPLETEDWISRIETIFEVMLCPDDRKVGLVTFLLEGEAKRWWINVRGRLAGQGQVCIPWTMFVQEFTGWFVPESEKKLLQDKFLRLVQGPRSVLEYETEFANLAFYAEAFVPNEKERCRRFQEGLRDSIRSILVPLEIRDYGALVQKARLMEIDAEKTQRRREFGKNRSQWTQSKESPAKFGTSWKSGDSGKRPRPQESGSVGQFPVQEQKCGKCGRSHKGQCLAGTQNCRFAVAPTHGEVATTKRQFCRPFSIAE
ncbi:hypothetical protein KSP39_PZI012149 [Platanthera zijinensis]|uniref:Retrotransposon gag domain-containing protein n=1 Tax=Platanthera zijinensis TaxID=2320716 RepID=A0AAP0BG07_9ASPA